MNKYRQKFNEDGYFIARNVLDRTSIDVVIESIKRTVHDQLEVVSARTRLDSDLFTLLQLLHHSDIDRYKRVLGTLWRKESAFALANDRRILHCLQDGLGWKDIFLPGGQVVLVMADELKIPGGYFGLQPHQDFPSVQGSLDGVVAWIPLFDVGRDTFPLEIIPKSHLSGSLPQLQQGPAAWEVDPRSFDENAFEAVEMSAGDVLFMSVFTLHRSRTKGRPGAFRIAISTRFDNGNETTFIDRVYPTAYLRSVERQPLTPNFPDQNLIQKTFS